MPRFPFYQQYDAKDCGPACLRMIAKFYGKNYSLQTLRDHSYLTREGVSMLGISDAAESIGFKTLGIKVSFNQLVNEIPLPCIVHWKQDHFIVLYKILQTRVNGKKDYLVHVADPAHGLIQYTRKEFMDSWTGTLVANVEKGLCLLLEPGPDFYANEDEPVNKSGFAYLLSYLRPYRKFVIQLVIGLIIGSLIQLIFPFLTQALVDIGISRQIRSFILLILIAQLVLLISRSAVEFIRSWILLHLSARINVSLISDFLAKLMKLPIAYFDTKLTGDLIQRIQDHQRIEQFMTTSSLSVVFSAFNLLVFGLVLLFYNPVIFLVFILGSALYIGWVSIFLNRRRNLDHKMFAQMSSNQSNIIQLVTAMQEIKLNNCEKQKRWEWENIQARIFRINIRNLTLSQYQQAGALLVNELKNIIITVLAAYSVLDGRISLGMMLSIQYIIGQLNSPLEQLTLFIHHAQDAKISLERLGEIHLKKDEEPAVSAKLLSLPSDHDIHVHQVSFQYEGPHSDFALRNINLIIPGKKVTAVVGTSGSGKTTLIKTLLGFYTPVEGSVKIGDTFLESIDSRFWRQNCGVVMQDGYIFNDSIARNIAMADDPIDIDKLLMAAKMANIRDFVESLPLSYNTKIGNEGHGLSQGQKQRILIARAVYKKPLFIFFDEATNALDASNELVVMQNLEAFFNERTVIIVAHRLSTVKNADQIIVLEKGELVETGTHDELTARKGHYYNLVKNQLEMGV
ncbi:MAG: peptidase domain-containing ABC transporter [Bacteroidales bacterium]|nr:peptidase domain-containing ABC transporter [Bacteroidales bacterium]MBN2762480.1 peptidase domain-containing ABC transporter [Bacteroidales bacterium]